MHYNSFFNPVRDEISQAKARFLLGILVLVYVCFLPVQEDSNITQDKFNQLIAIASITIFYALALIVFLRNHKKKSPVRQILSISFDVLLTSYGFYLAGEWAAVFIVLYLWIIIGNGIRFGLHYMAFTMTLTLLSFFVVIQNTHYWQTNQILSLGLLISFIILPLFFIYLITNLHKTRQQLEAELKNTARLANYDLLTQLPNRHSFNERLHHELEVAKRNKSFFSVLYMDLDGFKAVNDTYGHNMGDKLLIEVAQRLKSCVREIDLVARIGGDEFVYVTAAGNFTKNTSHLQKRLQDAVKSPVQIDDITLHIGMTIGQARYPDDGEEFEQLLAKSDQNMYQKKQRNKQQKAIKPSSI